MYRYSKSMVTLPDFRVIGPSKIRLESVLFKQNKNKKSPSHIIFKKKCLRKILLMFLPKTNNLTLIHFHLVLNQILQ